MADSFFLDRAPLLARDKQDEQINDYSARELRVMWTDFADDESRPEYAAWFALAVSFKSIPNFVIESPERQNWRKFANWG